MLARLVSLWLFLLLNSAAFSQFTMEGYLANAISDEEVQYSKSKQDFLDKNNFNSPIIREVEFRARVRNFGNGFEDYRLRFSPLNPFEKRANKNYQKALNEQVQMEYRMNLEEVLLSRYLLMIKHRELSEKITLLEESAEFYQRIMQVSQNISSSSALRDYIQLDKAQLNTILDLERARQNRDLIEQTIQYTYPFSSPISWSEQTIVDLASIRDWLASQKPSIANNLYLKNELEKETVDALEFKIEKNEAFRSIGYVQAEYREDQDRTFGENLGLQIAVNIPVVNPDKPDLQRDKLDLFEDSKKLEMERQEIERYIDSHFGKLASAFKTLELVENKITNYKDRSFNSTSNNNTIDLMVELHDFKTELAELSIETTAEILSLYIELLSLNGQLSEEPYVNFLSGEQKTFDLDY